MFDCFPQARSPGVAHIVHVVADREAMQTLLLRAPAFGQRYENLTASSILLDIVKACGVAHSCG
jgi:hypothetical protein